MCECVSVCLCACVERHVKYQTAAKAEFRAQSEYWKAHAAKRRREYEAKKKRLKVISPSITSLGCYCISLAL